MDNFDKLDDLILLKIFSYLSIKNLNNLSKVNKRCYHLVKETIDQRSPTVYLTLLNSNKWSLDKSAKNFQMSKKTFLEEFNSDLNSLMTKPDIYIYFLSKHFKKKCLIDDSNTNSDEPGPSPKRLRTSRQASSDIKLLHVSDVISNILPLNSQKLFFYTSDIIGTSLKTNVTKDYDIDDISGLLLPQSTQSYKFEIRKVNGKEKLPCFKSKNEMNDFFNVKMTEGELIKYILVIALNPKSKEIAMFLKALNQHRCSEDVMTNKLSFAVSGGFLYSSNEPTSTTLIALIMKRQGIDQQKVRVAQIILPEMDKSQFDDEFEKRLKVLKESKIDDNSKATAERKMFTIKINCVGRGSEYHGNSHHELNMFRKYFKEEDMPVIGFYGEGEIGHDYLPSFYHHREEEFEQLLTSSNFLWNEKIEAFAYSSVFTIIYLEN